MKRLLTGLQPTGVITLGNYIGAIKQMVEYQNDYESYIFVADLHSLTVLNDENNIKENTKSLIALYLACGIDPKKNTIFIQSDNEYHTNLAWILECHTYFGELSRMHQFKEKSKKNTNFSAGLFTYPVLMAADILLYDTDLVPVGIDQKQHVEIARDIAIRFNKKYGETFTVPDCLITKSGTKIMDLVTPDKKMSKSAENKRGVIYLLDSESDIRKKIMSAVTDMEAHVHFDPEKQPGISNLMTIMASLTGKSFEQIEKEFEGKGYGVFKPAVGEAVIETLRPIREEASRIIKDKAYLESVYKDGAARASRVADKTLYKVYKKVGFVLPK